MAGYKNEGRFDGLEIRLRTWFLVERFISLLAIQ